MTENATWLPNLVGGVSIWTLAADLNEPKFFDGRLLVPETEGSSSLPVSVRWDLTGLVPLAEARTRFPAETEAAIVDFEAALQRVAKVFGTAGSGYDKYKDAFTVPSLEGGGSSNYYVDPTSKKLLVVNWGASPRNVGGKAEYVFGYQDWSSVLRGAPGAAAVGGVGVAGVSAAAVSAAASPLEEATNAESEASKEKETDGKSSKRPWWTLPLFALAAIALVLLAFFLLRSCEEDHAAKLLDASDGTDGSGEATDADGVDGAALEEAGSDAEAADASSAEAGADATADANSEAGADAGDAGRDAGDAGRDGGLSENDDDGGDDDDAPGGGGGGGGGKVVVTLGPAAGGGGAGGKPSEADSKGGPHRRHYQADAVAWRVGSGADRVARTESRGQRFDVWLGRGKTFESVRVEWQDHAGKWHVH